MSEKRQVNMGLLEGLDENTFLGKVLTTTNEEIDEVFNTEVTDPSEKEVAAGPIGTLTPLEKALFAQAYKSNNAGKKIANDFNAFAKTPEFEALTDEGKSEKYHKDAKATNEHKKAAQRYSKMGWASVGVRYPAIESDDIAYGFGKDGNIYKQEAEEGSEEFPICPSCGERHPAHGGDLAEVLQIVFGGGGRRTKKKETAQEETKP